MRTFALFAAATLVVASVAFVAAGNNIVEIDTCTDKALCQAASCKHSSLPDMDCMSNNNITHPQMTMLVCNPQVKAVGLLFRYSDAACTTLQGTQAFECGLCDDKKMQDIRCIRKNGIESLEVDQCVAGCSQNCKPKYDVKIDSCITTHDDQGKVTGYVKYEGVRLENSVYVAKWDGHQCSGNPTKVDELPSDSCIEGTKVSCKYANTNATLPQWLPRRK